MKKLVYMAIVLMGTCACSSNDDNSVDNNGKELADAEPITLRNAEKVTSDNAFAFNLFQKTVANEDDDNIFVAPLSVSMALNMVLNGASGQTAEEMKAALQDADYSMEDINEYSRILREALLKVDPSTTINIANSIWYKNDFKIKDAFVKTNEADYNATVKSLDFTSPDAVTTINNWCSEQTNKKIPKVIDEIGGDMRYCLINATYFKGVWNEKFMKENTKTGTFYREDGTTAAVQMMEQTENFGYSEDDNCRYLQMLYGNKAFSMIVMLPNDGKTTQDVIDNLNNTSWNNLLFSGYKVHVRIPRFETECSYEMQDGILPALGMKKAFTNEAEFSGISNDTTYLSYVLHKTYVKVDEEGTEATGATVIGGATSPGPMDTLDFLVNKPFVFAIRENSTGVILFIGKMGNIKE